MIEKMLEKSLLEYPSLVLKYNWKWLNILTLISIFVFVGCIIYRVSGIPTDETFARFTIYSFLVMWFLSVLSIIVSKIIKIYRGGYE